VKNLKKKSLWSKTLEEVVEKLVDIVIFLHKQIRDSFNEAVHAGTNFFDSEHTQNKRLGSCGLALHYANIINQIENIVSCSDKPCNVYLFLLHVPLLLYIMAWQQISIRSPVHPECL
jgi:hypothetical protein